MTPIPVNLRFDPQRQEEYVSSIELMHEYPGHMGEIDRIREDSCLFSNYSQNAEIFVFGKPYNWKDNANLHLLLPTLEKSEVKTVYIPDCSDFTANISDVSEFQKEFDIGGIMFKTGCNTDGLVIPKGSAVIFRTADCPTIVLHDIENDLLLGTHAGLESLIDKKKLTTGAPFRSNDSVVDEIVRFIPSSSTNHYEIFVVGGISSSNFVYNINDPVYGETNRKIFYYLNNNFGRDAVPRNTAKGNISLFGIIRCQFERYGFDPDKVVSDGLNTFSDPMLWSHYEECLHSNKGIERNCVLIIHK